MRKHTLRGIAVAAVVVAFIGAAADHARASSICGGPSALIAKVYRVFGDEAPAEDGAKTAKRPARKRSRRCATKRPRVERHVTPSPEDPDAHTGVLELIQPNA